MIGITLCSQFIPNSLKVYDIVPSQFFFISVFVVLFVNL